MHSLTILGGRGFVGSAYVRAYYHHAIGNIAKINERLDYEVYSPDVLHLIAFVQHQLGVFQFSSIFYNWRRSC
jgi:hypothetical protein